MENARKKSLYSGIFVMMAALMFTFSSCNKDNANGNNVVFKATLNGASETPPNTSAATGDATLTFNETDNTFSVVVNYSGLTATGAHIHKGAYGVPGNVVFPFSPITSPIKYTSSSLDSTQKADLFANQYYVNIHSAAFPAGEIRGQLIKQ
jgi:hypothetical protein